MVDTCVSGAYGAIRGGSSPPFGISKLKIKLIQGRRTPAKQSLAIIGFQDSLDAFLLAMMPNCRGFEADL